MNAKTVFLCGKRARHFRWALRPDEGTLGSLMAAEHSLDDVIQIRGKCDRNERTMSPIRGGTAVLRRGVNAERERCSSLAGAEGLEDP